MQVHLLTRSAKLAQLFRGMFQRSQPRYSFFVHDEVSTFWPKNANDGVIIFDAELPASAVMKLLERRESDLSVFSLIVLVSSELAHRKVPGFEGVRHLALPAGKELLLSAIQSEIVTSENEPQAYRVGRLTFNIALRKVFVENRILNLTGKEYELLELLALHDGVVISKKNILDALYDENWRPGEKIVDVFICKIRSKIKMLTGGDGLIDTVWGSGYVLFNSCIRPNGHSGIARPRSNMGRG